MEVLLAIEEREIRQIARFCLEKTFDLHVHEAESFDECFALIKEKNIQAILCSLTGLAKPITEFLATQDEFKPKIFAITFNEKEKVISQKQNLPWPYPITGFLECPHAISGFAQGVAANPIPTDQLNPNQFQDLRTSLLLRASPLPADVYIQLSPTKHIRLFARGDYFGTEDYEKYGVHKKLAHLFCRAPETNRFAQMLNAALEHLTPPPKPIPFDEEAQKAYTALTKDNVLDAIANIKEGIPVDKEIQDVVNHSVKEVVKLMGATPKLKNILGQMIRDKDKYITSHSLMVANIACAIAKGLQWGSEATFLKLTMAAFLHDSTLQNQSLAQIKTLAELEARKSEFTPEEITAYKNHSVAAAELAKSFYEIPKDVDMIIVQHHERPEGGGFPRGLSHSRMHPMAAVFNIAHDAVDFFYDGTAKTLEFDKFYAKYEKEYVGANFKKALRSMQDAMKSKI